MRPGQLLAALAAIAVMAAPAAAAKRDSQVTFIDALGDELILAAATAPLHGDDAHDLARVALQVDGRHLRVTLATVGAVATDPFAGYDVTAASTGTCPGTVFDSGFPVEFRFRAGPDGRGALYVKACRTGLSVPAVVSGSTISASVPLSALPAVRGTTLRGIHAVAGVTDFTDAGTMRVILDQAATSTRLAVP